MKVIESMAALVVGILLPVLAACLILSQLAGCFGGGGRVYLGYERIDELQETRKLLNQPLPWKCLIIDCKEENGNIKH